MKARLDHPAEVAVCFFDLNKMEAGDAIARLRMRLVVSPRAVPQIGERPERAPSAHDHIREVNGLSLVTLPHKDGCGDRFENLTISPNEFDVRQAAKKGKIDLPGKLLIGGTYREASGILELLFKGAA